MSTSGDSSWARSGAASRARPRRSPSRCRCTCSPTRPRSPASSPSRSSSRPSSSRWWAAPWPTHSTAAGSWSSRRPRWGSSPLGSSHSRCCQIRRFPWSSCCAALLTTFFAIEHPARTSAVPRLVPPERLSSAIALSSLNFQVSGLVAPAIAGIVIALSDVSIAYSLQAFAYAWAVLLTLRVRPIPALQDRRPPKPARHRRRAVVHPSADA